MQEHTVKVLDESDLEFSETLQRIGVPRNVSLLITYLAGVPQASSRQIEMATTLRQPEVSVAMRTMRVNQWVDEKETKREGKGRPMKIYSLKVSVDDIIRHYEEIKRQESEEAMAAFRRLKELSATSV